MVSIFPHFSQAEATRRRDCDGFRTPAQEDVVGTSRIPIIVGVALFAGLLSMGAQAQTEPKATASTPLTQTPVAAQTTKARSTNAEARKSARASTRRAAPAEPTTAESDGTVMRGPDNIGLIARLPWWRSNEMQTIRYLDKAVASQVLTTADSWLGLTPDPMDDDAGKDARTVMHVVAAEETTVGEAGGAIDSTEPNAIDLAASDDSQPANKSWLQGLLALLGGALAAASTARFLFV
jgi:hypothetical protein